ncbi:MAG: hypothetical protein IJC30_03430 [Alphaproteobacteria bacterium]|nr:hypothetical protein [Alphaproteobacteria bacterium]
MSYIDDKASISEAPLLWFNLYNPSIDYYEFYNDLFSIVQQHNIPLPHFNPIDRWREKKPELIIVRFGFNFPKDLLPFYTKLPDLPNVYLKKK